MRSTNPFLSDDLPEVQSVDTLDMLVTFPPIQSINTPDTLVMDTRQEISIMSLLTKKKIIKKIIYWIE